jgi:hypothetical protein
MKESERLSSARVPEHLKVFITTWNMGNAEAVGVHHIFEEEKVTDNFDIFGIGLQESTYSMKVESGTDCIAHLGKQLQEALGPTFYLVIF